jgi:hypothetical protein
MPHILTQNDFQRRRKLTFCYLCGQPLKNDTNLNDDHCPPKAIFKDEDRENYSLTLKVHESCNSRWHKYDEQFSILYDALHGGPKIEAKRDMEIIDVQNTEGIFPAVTGVPFIELGFRVAQCAHALMYATSLPANMRRCIHVPLREVDTRNANQMKQVLPHVHRAAETLCTSQKTSTYNSLVVYGGKFRFVSTWVHISDGTSLCMFAFDIYRMAPLGWGVPGFPRCFVGYYLEVMPSNAVMCASEDIKHTDAEVTYPILI